MALSTENDNIVFVYRSHYEGPVSKRVRRLQGKSVLEWFQTAWKAMDGDVDCDEWVKEELGGRVYGLDSIFEARQEHNLPAPRSWQELLDLLDEHLYVEGEIRTNGRSLRISTDDDEVDLAYFLLDPQDVKEHPDRLAYMLYEGWELPGGSASGDFEPEAPCDALAPAGSGSGMTFCVLLTFYDSDSFPEGPTVFPGVRLPGLAEYMRSVTPVEQERGKDDYRWEESWPQELLVLRGLLEPGEQDLRQALERCNEWPGFILDTSIFGETFGIEDYASSHAKCQELRQSHPVQEARTPEKTLIHYTDHMAQLCIHMNDFFGYQQWFLFDDTWASAHPDLAQSLLWYCHTWDALEGT